MVNVYTVACTAHIGSLAMSSLTAILLSVELSTESELLTFVRWVNWSLGLVIVSLMFLLISAFGILTQNTSQRDYKRECFKRVPLVVALFAAIVSRVHGTYVLYETQDIEYGECVVTTALERNTCILIACALHFFAVLIGVSWLEASVNQPSVYGTLKVYDAVVPNWFKVHFD